MNKCISFLLVVFLAAGCSWGKNALLHTQDENIRISISKAAYSQTETIELEITVIKNVDLSAGWCGSYFERKTESGWEEADPCVPPDDPTMEVMPSPRASGTVEKLSLPIKDIGLTPGLYRYKLSYIVGDQIQFLYSPEFSVNDR